MSGAGRKPCARSASRSLSSIRNGFAASPKRPDDWPRTIRSTPRRSPHVAESFTIDPHHSVGARPGHKLEGPPLDEFLCDTITAPEAFFQFRPTLALRFRRRLANCAREPYRRMCPALTSHSDDKAQQRAIHIRTSRRHQVKMLSVVEIPDLPASAGVWLGLSVRGSVRLRHPPASGLDFCADDRRFGPRHLACSRQFRR